MTTKSLQHPPFKFTDKRPSDLPAPDNGKPYTRQGHRADRTDLSCPPAEQPSPERQPHLVDLPQAEGGNAPVRVNICKAGELPMTALKGQPVGAQHGRRDPRQAPARDQSKHEQRQRSRPKPRDSNRRRPVAGITLAKPSRSMSRRSRSGRRRWQATGAASTVISSTGTISRCARLPDRWR